MIVLSARLIVAVPCAGFVTDCTDRVSPSTSTSLSNTRIQLTLTRWPDPRIHSDLVEAIKHADRMNHLINQHMITVEKNKAVLTVITMVLYTDVCQ